MLHTDATFAARVEAAVVRIEKQTDAEVVVVAVERSGTYRDRSMIAAALGTFVTLLVILYIPWSVPPILVALDVALAWPLLVWLFGAPAIVRQIATRERLDRQVRDAAEAEFVREAVHGTPNRTGILVFVSALEGRVELIPDLGVAGRIAPGDLATASRSFQHDDLDSFVRGLDALGELLARAVPHTEGSDAFDLPNAPRVRP